MQEGEESIFEFGVVGGQETEFIFGVFVGKKLVLEQLRSIDRVLNGGFAFLNGLEDLFMFLQGRQPFPKCDGVIPDFFCGFGLDKQLNLLQVTATVSKSKNYRSQPLMKYLNSS